MNVDRIAVEVVRERLRITLEHVKAVPNCDCNVSIDPEVPNTNDVNRDVAIALLQGTIKEIDGWLDNEPPAWRPISDVPGLVPSAWIFIPDAGVIHGSLGKFNDGCVHGKGDALHGCIVRDWGATTWMPCPIPERPKL